MGLLEEELLPMGGHLQNEFFYAMMRIKKMGAMFTSECEIQMNELAILRAAADECQCCPGSSINLNVPQLQDQLHITKPAISYILNTLEKKDYIVRTIDPKDRRKISISVTANGMAAAKQSEKAYEQMWGELLSRFGEEDMRALLGLLYRLLDVCNDIQCGCDKEA